MVNIDIAQLFTNVGYPIAMSVLFALYIKHQSDQMKSEREKSDEIVRGFMQTLQEYNSKLEAITDKLNLIFQKIGGNWHE